MIHRCHLSSRRPVRRNARLENWRSGSPSRFGSGARQPASSSILFLRMMHAPYAA